MTGTRLGCVRGTVFVGGENPPTRGAVKQTTVVKKKGPPKWLREKTSRTVVRKALEIHAKPSPQG